MPESRIDPADVAAVFTGLDGLLAGAAAEQPLPIAPDEASPHVAEVRTSRPYAQLVHREIDSVEYARRLKEEVVGQRAVECSSARRWSAPERVRYLELQARKAALFEEYVSAQRAAYEAQRRNARAVWRLVGELALGAALLALALAVMWVGGAGSLQAVRDGVRDLTGAVPDRVSMSVSLGTAGTLCLLALVSRVRRASPEPPS